MQTEPTAGRRGGRPPAYVELNDQMMTIAEAARVLGMTPGGVWNRMKRVQAMSDKPRYRAITDVTKEPRRKPVERVDPVEQRRRDVDEALRRMREPGCPMDERALAEAMWDAGHGCGAGR